MKLNHTAVKWVNEPSEPRITSLKILKTKRVLAKDCSLCSENWIYSEKSPVKAFIKKLFFCSKRYCTCVRD
ncbi:hypothetical protein LNTAR_10331 [Lentisphaera araneosa HTCC2155]|uniref:Uncharacterized protein n=1 Tax=Lentisphaera araneosa HTCC2155 TaxID=313628 RepID=A6DIL9_9BACT|nr:hypothetical protein LNTAR_10331 [Lentisphaera araneosa HTCC2155]